MAYFTNCKPCILTLMDPPDRPVAALSITQLVKVVNGPQDKLTALVEYISSKPKGSRIIIFVATKSRCDWLGHSLMSGA